MTKGSVIETAAVTATVVMTTIKTAMTMKAHAAKRRWPCPSHSDSPSKRSRKRHVLTTS